MLREPLQEAVQRVCSARGKVGAKSVPSDVLWDMVSGRGARSGGLEGLGDERTHFVFVWQRRDGALRKLARERLVQKDKVRETPADSNVVALERFEVGLVGGGKVGGWLAIALLYGGGISLELGVFLTSVVTR